MSDRFNLSGQASEGIGSLGELACSRSLNHTLRKLFLFILDVITGSVLELLCLSKT